LRKTGKEREQIEKANRRKRKYAKTNDNLLLTKHTLEVIGGNNQKTSEDVPPIWRK